jgi:hypothetical protein
LACSVSGVFGRDVRIITGVCVVAAALNDRARFSAIAFTWHGFLSRDWWRRGSGDGWYVGKPTCRIVHFLPKNQKVVRMSKLGFPTSHPALMVIPLNHGLQSHVTKRAESRTVI